MVSVLGAAAGRDVRAAAVVGDDGVAARVEPGQREVGARRAVRQRPGGRGTEHGVPLSDGEGDRPLVDRAAGGDGGRQGRGRRAVGDRHGVRIGGAAVGGDGQGAGLVGEGVVGGGVAGAGDRVGPDRADDRRRGGAGARATQRGGRLVADEAGVGRGEGRVRRADQPALVVGGDGERGLRDGQRGAADAARVGVRLAREARGHTAGIWACGDTREADAREGGDAARVGGGAADRGAAQGEGDRLAREGLAGGGQGRGQRGGAAVGAARRAHRQRRGGQRDDRHGGGVLGSAAILVDHLTLDGALAECARRAGGARCRARRAVAAAGAAIEGVGEPGGHVGGRGVGHAGERQGDVGPDRDRGRGGEGGARRDVGAGEGGGIGGAGSGRVVDGDIGGARIGHIGGGDLGGQFAGADEGGRAISAVPAYDHAIDEDAAGDGQGEGRAALGRRGGAEAGDGQHRGDRGDGRRWPAAPLPLVLCAVMLTV